MAKNPVNNEPYLYYLLWVNHPRFTAYVVRSDYLNYFMQHDCPYINEWCIRLIHESTHSALARNGWPAKLDVSHGTINTEGGMYVNERWVSAVCQFNIL